MQRYVNHPRPNEGDSLNLFDVSFGSGPRGGMTVEIGAGPAGGQGTAPRIYLTDEAYSFVEPVLARIAPHYHPDTRWRIAELDAGVWRQAIVEFNGIVARLNAGGTLDALDVAWVHTVDLDSGVETSTDAFLQKIDSVEGKAALCTFLLSWVNWIDEHLRKEAILTIYGY